MCDCYSHKCEFCDNEISIHIADFCTERKNVKIVCPDCLEAVARIDGIKIINTTGISLIFIDKLEFREQITKGELKDGKYKGKIVLFLCNDPEAYGIQLN